jgi:glycosyltransferase involved in cell wall biosynthesis
MGYPSWKGTNGSLKSLVESPRVSVVIPTFNRGGIIGEAVESVLSQEGIGFELIVVDDGSTDNTSEVLSAFQKHIILIRQTNQGVSAARNRGIRKARGDLIAFLDSDDKWLSGKLSRQVAFFDRHPDALICQTEEIWIKDGKRVNPKRRHTKVSGMIFEQCLPLCLISPSAVMMKQSLFAEVGLFDENLPACEDYDLWLRVSSRYPVYLIDTPLIVKRGGHADQLSRTPGLDRFRIRALEKIIAGGRLSPSQWTAALEMLKEKCAIYAAGCLKRGRKKEAAYYFELPTRCSEDVIYHK